MNGGYQEPHVDQLMQANKGADFDFLVRCHSAAIAGESHSCKVVAERSERDQWWPRNNRNNIMVRHLPSHYLAVQPPSIRMSVPVIKAACSEQR